MSVFLDACRRKPTPYTPIWLMRQAGRYQPEYRAIRDKLSFIELCQDSDRAAEVTCLAVTQLGVDAAIIFADILLVLGPMGIGFEFTKDDGPRILTPIRSTAQVGSVRGDIEAGALGFVYEAIRKTKRGLPSGIPLIGFAGAPFTLASYVIEGAGSKNYHETKKLMWGDPGAFRALLEKLTDAVITYLNAQIDAGADAVQVFDSWVGCLSERDYVTHVFPHMKRLFGALHGKVPHIHFGTGNPALYPHMRRAGGDVIGLDWRVEIDAIWPTLGDVAVQGNLDAAALLAPRDRLLAEADAVLRAAGGRPGHVFNLGHGIMPEAKVDQVRALVDHVHERSAQGRS